MLVLGSLIYGMAVGFVAAVAVFAIIAGVYTSIPRSMQQWEGVAWGVCFALLMQLVAVVRRLYVYI